MCTSVRDRQHALWQQIERFKPHVGKGIALDSSIKRAFFENPRHRFVDGFRLASDTRGRLARRPSDPDGIEAVYRNEPLMYVSEDGSEFEASSSEPGFLMHLLALLDVREGHRVLEIGCGTGWLLAMLSSLVGASGRVIGVKVQPALAALARRNISRTGRGNIEITCRDGSQESVLNDLGIYDRVIVTASMGDIPASFYGLLKKGGILIVPVRNKGLAEEVLVLERVSFGFRSKAVRLCKFVRMTGGDGSDFGGLQPGLRQDQAEFSNEPISAVDCPVNGFSGAEAMRHVLPLSSFLSKRHPGFRAWKVDADDLQNSELSVFGDWNTFAMGIRLYAPNDSLCVWHKGRLLGYGSTDAERVFLELLDQWQSLGRPTGAHFEVMVLPRGTQVTVPRNRHVCLDHRESSSFIWVL